MPKKNWLKNIMLNIHAPGTSFALMVLALTQVPVGIKNTAEIACIGQASNKIWKLENNHAEANMLAVQRCNGRK
tara:strand:- start:3325 stop:3546 length:222 start_codon:yes stop_codon:yes gene_type:complete